MNSSGVPEINDSAQTEHRGFCDYTLLYESKDGYSVLYRVKQGEKYYILKGVKPNLGDTTRYEQLLKRECELLMSIESIHVVDCHGMIEDERLGACILMQYIDGTTLSQWLKEKQSFKDKRRIADELLDAVSDLHSHQIIHNDIKPDNILITRSGSHVKIVDLGLSDNDSYICHGRGFTDDYAAPEQLENGSSDTHTDIWSSGKILSEIFGGGRYSCVIKKCLRKNPSRRYSSISDVKNALRGTDTLIKLFLIAIAIIATSVFIVLLINSHNKAIQEELHEVKSNIEAVTKGIDSTSKNLDSISKRVEIKELTAEEKNYNICVGRMKQYNDSLTNEALKALEKCDWTCFVMIEQQKYHKLSFLNRDKFAPSDKELKEAYYKECEKHYIYCYEKITRRAEELKIPAAGDAYNAGQISRAELDSINNTFSKCLADPVNAKY